MAICLSTWSHSIFTWTDYSREREWVLFTTNECEITILIFGLHSFVQQLPRNYLTSIIQRDWHKHVKDKDATKTNSALKGIGTNWIKWILFYTISNAFGRYISRLLSIPIVALEGSGWCRVRSVQNQTRGQCTSWCSYNWRRQREGHTKILAIHCE